jgi:hypothetical protein
VRALAISNDQFTFATGSADAVKVFVYTVGV